MNILLFSEIDKISHNEIRVSDYRLQHLKKRLQNNSAPDFTPGNRLRVGEINGLMGSGVISCFTEHCVEIELGPLIEQPPKPLDVVLIIALPRPKMLKRIFREATSLGIKTFYIINSYKVDKSYWKSPALDTKKLNHYLLEGLEQSIDTILPAVHLKRLFKPFVEDELPHILQDRNCFVAHPEAKTQCPAAIPTPATIAIGPEGGFTDYEVSKLIALGFEGVTLGKRILKVETAIPVLTGRCF